MAASILKSPAGRLLLKTLGYSPREKLFRLDGDLGKMSRILLVDSGRLSDLLFFLPVIEGLRESAPGVEIEVMTLERWGEFLKREPGVSGLILYDPAQLKLRSTAFHNLLKEVKRRQFDAVMLMSDLADPMRDLVAFASGAPLRIGADDTEREAFLNCTVRWGRSGRYRMDLARELSRFLGLQYDPAEWSFAFQPEELRAADQLIHFRKPVKEQILIGVDSATGLGESRLVESHLAYIVGHLAGSLRAKVMLFNLDEPGEGEDGFASRLGGNVLDTPELGLRETLALLSRCDLFVAGNTELFHASVVFGVPSLGLFTDSDRLDWEPRDRGSVAVLRGKPGEKISLSELEASVKRILHAAPA